VALDVGKTLPGPNDAFGLLTTLAADLRADPEVAAAGGELLRHHRPQSRLAYRTPSEVAET
jgi:hypothetical protein